MLLDARTIPGGTKLNAAACVIGAGPVGIAVSRALIASGLEVILVEAGGFQPEKEIEALSAGEVAEGSRHAPLTLYRRRVVGGSSYVWGGRCTPFDPIDFEARPWLPLSGWPITYAQILPWYEQANLFLDAGRFDYTVQGSLADKTEFIGGFSNSLLHTDRIERFSCPVNAGRKYRRELKRSTTLRLLHHAVVTQLHLHKDGIKTEAIELRSTDGGHLQVAANVFVLAAGTLESVRLLLGSRDVLRDGIGNQSGWLGRSYLAHLEANIGELRLKPSDRPVIWGYEKSTDGVYVRRRFSVSATGQEKYQIGNGIARLNHPSIVDPSHGNGILSAAFFTKFLLVPEYSRRISWVDRRTAAQLAGMSRFSLLRNHALNVLRDLPRIATFGPWWLWVRNLSHRKMPSLVLPSKAGSYPLDVNVEQSPNPHSRLYLAGTRDRFGVPQLGVDWRMNSEDEQTIKGTLMLIRKAVADSGCGEFIVDLDEAVEQFNPVGGHQMGGARMSADPNRGVVDSQCRVHGIDNLYLAGSQIFPTVGYANPTLTAVALAMRLAQHLQGRLKS